MDAEGKKNKNMEGRTRGSEEEGYQPQCLVVLKPSILKAKVILPPLTPRAFPIKVHIGPLFIFIRYGLWL